MMTSKLAVEELAIEEALAAMMKNPLLKGREAATLYNANYHRLMPRRHGRPASSTRGGHNKKLEEPSRLRHKRLLIMLFHAEAAANLEHVQHAASILVATLSGDPKATVSRQWSKRWMVRQRDFLSTLKAKPISVLLRGSLLDPPCELPWLACRL